MGLVYLVFRLIDISVQVELQKKLHSLAFYDVLTGIFNRNHFLQEQLSVYIQAFIEDFSFVIKDLAKNSDKPVVVEGNQLLPSLVSAHLNEHHKAIWIIPTEQFQKAQYSKMEWIQDRLQSTENPTVAFKK